MRFDNRRSFNFIHIVHYIASNKNVSPTHPVWVTIVKTQRLHQKIKHERVVQLIMNSTHRTCGTCWRSATKPKGTPICTRHQCKEDGCFDHVRVIEGKHNPTHNELMWKIKHKNIGAAEKTVLIEQASMLEDDMYSNQCSSHGCSVCGSPKRWERYFCDRHQCTASEYCRFKRIDDKSHGFCQNHYCHTTGCTALRSQDSSKYCESHRCKGHNSSSYATMSSQCFEHCTKGMADGRAGEACSEHFCQVKDCDHVALMKTHVIHYGPTDYHPHGMSYSRLLHLKHCKYHVCSFGSCTTEVNQAIGMGSQLQMKQCAAHKCKADGCTKSWHVKKSHYTKADQSKWIQRDTVHFCPDHICKTSKCVHSASSCPDHT